MQVTRIKAPKYKVGRYTLNEYELRTLQYEVAQGLKPHGIKVKDERGTIATIQPDGTMDCNVYGYDINSLCTIGILRIKREKKSQS